MRSLAFGLVCCLAACSPPEGSPSADQVFVNAKVYTVDASQPWAEALAVGEGRLVAVGTREAAMAVAASDASVVDLEGRLVLPGFIDTHLDAVAGALRAGGLDLSENTEPQAPLDAEPLQRAFAEFARRAARDGLTGFLDRGVGGADDRASRAYQAMAELDAERPLPFRMRASHVVLPASGADPVAAAQALRTKLPSGRVRAGVLALKVDGSPESHTAALLEPYADRPGKRGEPLFSEEDLHEIVAAAYAADLDVQLRVSGDRGVRIALDAVEAARRRHGQRDVRVSLVHAGLVDAQDLPRFAALEVGWSTPGRRIEPDPLYDRWEQVLGAERQRRIFPLQSLLEAGARVGWAGDGPAAAPFPTTSLLDRIQMGMTRRRPDAVRGRTLPAATERITLAQGIRAATLDAAWMLRIDDVAGSLEVGKSADFVVLDKNLFELPMHRIHTAAVLRTVFEGRAVYP